MKAACIAAGLVFLLTVPLCADFLVDESIGFQVYIPDNWEIESEQGRYLAMDPQYIAMAVIIPVQSENYEKDVLDIEVRLVQLFDEIKITEEPEEMDLNGLPAFIAFGTGTIQEQSMIWGLVVAYNAKTDVTLFVIVFTFADTYDAYEDALLDILASVSAANVE